MVECFSRPSAENGELLPWLAGYSRPTTFSESADARKSAATNLTVLSAIMASSGTSPNSSGMPSTWSMLKSIGGPGCLKRAAEKGLHSGCKKAPRALTLPKATRMASLMGLRARLCS